MSDQEEIKQIINDLYNINCPILDIGERVGKTDYIDFIDTKEFLESFNKGVDKYGRKFISFRVNIEYRDNRKRETFTTLFQRYKGEEWLWLGAGKNVHLFQTDGGASLDQLKLLYKLLNENSVDISEDNYINCRLTPYKYIWDGIDNNPPIRIYLVPYNQNEKLLEVMEDLENKVNPKSFVEGISRLDKSIQTEDSSFLLASMQESAKEFRQKLGRPMTYGEMREMWG